jgi:flagellar motor switch protein FliN/FliY
MADDQLMSQDEIERLLGQAGAGAPKAAAPSAAGGAPSPTAAKPAATMVASPPRDPSLSEGAVLQADVEFLLNQAEQALASINTANETPPGVSAFRLQEFGGATPNAEAATIDLVSDVELDLRIELGRTHMYLEDILKLRKGAVVPLDKLAGDPVDIYVNGRLIARGEVLVLNDNFCVRVAELIAGKNVYA